MRPRRHQLRSLPGPDRRPPAAALLLTLALAACGTEPATPGADPTATAATPDPRPNLVLVLVDDLGPEGYGPYGGTLGPTPALDRLAAEGVRFTDAHTTPLCTPTRVRLMTGRSGPRAYTGFRTLAPSERTFAHQLQDAGYATWVAGKWQLAGRRGPVASGLSGSRPEEAGFERWCLWQVEELGSRYADPTLEVDGESVVLEGRYGPDVVVETALAWLAEPRDRPFLLYYPMILPHDPFEPTPRSLEARADEDPQVAARLAAETDEERAQRHFADMAAYVDHNVGRLLDGLDAAGIADDTLVVVTSDNGTSRLMPVVVDGVPMVGSKAQTHELGTKMPLLLRWPGVVAPGTTMDRPVDLMDLMPTLVEAGGAALPDDRVIDGLSLVPHLTTGAAWPREVLAMEYDPYPGVPGRVRHRFARGLGLKLYDDGRVFRTAEDPREFEALAEADLTEAERESLPRLRAALAALPPRPPAPAGSSER